MINSELDSFIEENKKYQWSYPENIPDNLWETDWPWSQINANGEFDFSKIIKLFT